MPLFDFVCSHGHETEALRPSAATSIACPVCDAPAVKAAVHRVAMAVGADRDWTSPVRDNGRIRTPVGERRVPMRQFTEATEQIAHEHAKAEESAQRELPTPPLWETAKKAAKVLEKAGIHDSLDMPK